MRRQSYSIGLDIGVSSVGWVCLSPQYEVLKYQGKYAIGTREFSPADTAEERRTKRGARRRYNRRIKRIQLLQQTLQPLFKDDEGFFMQHEEKEKHFWRNSNQFRNNTLSETLDYLGMNTRQFPTIYHLRHALISNKEKYHPRLIYLALHHLTKFRGHFLNENKRWTVSKDTTLQESLKTYFSLLNEYAYEIDLLNIDFVKMESTLKDQTSTSSDKRNALKRQIGREFHHPINLLVGLKTDLVKLFPNSDQKRVYEEEKLSIHFSKKDYTEVYDRLTDEEKAIIDEAQIIYQSINLFELLGEADYVSEAKVRDYERFKKDLKLLKYIYDKYLGEEIYRETFITSRKNWTKFKHTHNKKLLSEFDRFLKDKKGYEDKFYGNVQNRLKSLLHSGIIKDTKDENYVKDAISRLNSNQFLPKQKTYLNAAIPHQNNVYEAEIILKNQKEFYPEITNEMIERIKQIISFRIPYYIGPLAKDENQSEFAWLVRKKDDLPVLPWNIDEVIDRSASAEKFINKMTSYCMYLKDKKVLPKHSLLYERFEVLNELNGIQIRSPYEVANRRHRLPTKVKQWILENVFTKRKNITINYLKTELKKHDEFKDIIIDFETDTLKDITGTQKEHAFGSSLSSFIDMVNIFGKVDDTNINMIEDIIYWITVFEDKQIVELKIKERYPQVTSEQLKQLLRLNYTGWGRLSRKLLDGIPADEVSNRTIIEVMENESQVFMEVLTTEKYLLQEKISKINRNDDQRKTKIKYDDIARLQGSPAIKKGIWQAISIVEDLVEIFGEPEHIMIEFARDDEYKGGTQNVQRKKRVEKLAKEVSNEEKELKKFLQKHSKYDLDAYKNQRLMLYITQQGKCMYSGVPLDINRLHEYQVDHIYPRSFVVDNSFDNLALVTYNMNSLKGSTKMPLEIIEEDKKYKQKMFWRKLRENGLISDKKYFRLLKKKFTDQDKERFFARQLVETRQITKHVKDLLEERFESTEIHTVNASIVSKLREHCQVLKIRNLNNKHHAVDATLAATIILFIINEYGQNFLDFSFKYQHVQKKWRHLMKQYGKNFFLFSKISQAKSFSHYKTGEIITGNQYFHMINDEIPWQTTKKIGTEEAAFYKETLHSPKKKQPKYISSKLKHGVYDEMKTECIYLISFKEEDKKGRIKKKSDFVDLYVIEEYQLRGASEKELAIFLAGKIAKGKVLDAKIHTKIEKYQLIEIDNDPFYFISSGELHNAKQLVLPKEVLRKYYQTLDLDEKVDIEFLQEVFLAMAKVVNEEYKVFLPKGHRERILNYVDEIKDLQTYHTGVEEVFNATIARKSRSKLFEYRFKRKSDRAPHKVKFVHQSVTGLRSRRPRSYRHELWSL